MRYGIISLSLLVNYALLKYRLELKYNELAED
jgi:hypothetical protein